MACGVVGHATFRVLETNPLDRRVLGTVVHSLVLGGVGDREDVAERVVGAVDFTQAVHSLRAPDIDDRVAGTGKKKRPIVGEKKAHDATLVGLDAVDWLEVAQRPDEYLAILSTGIYVVVVDNEGEHGALVLEGMDELRSRVRGHFEDGPRCGRSRHRRHIAYRDVACCQSSLPYSFISCEWTLRCQSGRMLEVRIAYGRDVTCWRQIW